VLQGPSLHGGGIGIDDAGIDFILGLDNLMRHQCSIDLKVSSSPCPPQQKMAHLFRPSFLEIFRPSQFFLL
jgi:hypothetical protein